LQHEVLNPIELCISGQAWPVRFEVGGGRNGNGESRLGQFQFFESEQTAEGQMGSGGISGYEQVPRGYAFIKQPGVGGDCRVELRGKRVFRREGVVEGEQPGLGGAGNQFDEVTVRPGIKGISSAMKVEDGGNRMRGLKPIAFEPIKCDVRPGDAGAGGEFNRIQKAARAVEGRHFERSGQLFS